MQAPVDVHGGAAAREQAEGVHVAFDEVWGRRLLVEVAPGVSLALPCVADLIATKRFGARPKDAEDIRLLAVLQSKQPA